MSFTDPPCMAFATGKRSNIWPLQDIYHFLHLIYKHHSNAEDELHFLLFVWYILCLFTDKIEEKNGNLVWVLRG